jgi:FkbM family methyltransferase
VLSSLLHRSSAWLFHAAAALGFGGRRALAGWIMHSLRLPVAWLPPVAGFGRLAHRNEFESITENFFAGTLRFPPLERDLRTARDALVMDVGVNLGVTLRWWLHLNARTEIIAVDMIREAHEFAARALDRVDPRWVAQVRAVHAVVSDAPGRTVIAFDDPLEGTNAADARQGATRREVVVRTLDEIWADAGSRDVLVLKIDIEGAGGAALRGASQVLRRTRFVAAEWHGPAELGQITAACLDAGLSLAAANAKMLFFERTAAA